MSLMALRTKTAGPRHCAGSFFLVQLRMASKHPAKFDCSICLSRCQRNEVVLCSCKHATCKSCIVQLVASTSLSKKGRLLRCAVDGCSDYKPYSPEALATALWSDTGSDDGIDPIQIRKVRATLLRSNGWSLIQSYDLRRLEALRSVVLSQGKDKLRFVSLPWFSSSIQQDPEVYTPIDACGTMWSEQLLEEAESAVFEIMYDVLVGYCRSCHMHYTDMIVQSEFTVACRTCGLSICRKCRTPVELLENHSIQEHARNKLCTATQYNLESDLQMRVSDIFSQLPYVGREMALGIIMFFTQNH